VDVRLLEGVTADRAPCHLAGDRHQRDRVAVGVGDRGDQVGGSRSGGGDAHPHPAGRLRIPGRRVPRGLLVADQDVTYRGIPERIVWWEDRTSGAYGRGSLVCYVPLAYD